MKTSMRSGLTVLGLATVLLTPFAGAANASQYSSSSVTQVSGGAPTATGDSPFASCDITGHHQDPSWDTNFLNAEVGPALAVDPTNPSNMLGAWQQDRWSSGGSRGVMAGVSRDGGGTWTPSIPHFSVCTGGTKANGGNFERASYPAVAFAADGDSYVMAPAFNLMSDPRSAMLVAKSADGGSTWGEPTQLVNDPASSGVHHGASSIVADPYDSNYVYALWQRSRFPSGSAPSEGEHRVGGPSGAPFRSDVMFSRTTDGGRTWEPARAIHEPKALEGTFLGNHQVTVAADGTLVDVFTVQTGTANQAQPYEVRVMTSKDRGTTWSRPSALAPWRPIPVVDPESGLLIGYFGAVDVAADRNPASPGVGKLYAVWADAASTFDHRFPRGAHPGRDYTNVVITESADGGRTWTPPTEIDRSPPGVASFTPSVAVAADGTVGVTYYDVRNNTPEPGMPTDYWLVRCDGGTGCTSLAGWDETHVGGSFDVEQAPLCPGWYTLGLNMGLVNVGNSFYSMFTQTTETDKANQYLAVTSP